VLMLTSVYLVMPVVRVRFRHALIGGITATVIWEITRRVLVWYYGVVSTANLIHGPFATVVVALLSVDIVALTLLLGAQVIAELERKPGESTGEEQSGFET
jgi:membrane protein